MAKGTDESAEIAEYRQAAGGAQRHATTFRELAAEYPSMVRVFEFPNDPDRNHALIRIPFSFRAEALMEKVSEAHWVPLKKSWRVRHRVSRQLREALWSISQHPGDFSKAGLIDLTGQRFGRLIVLSLHHSRYHKGSVWVCRCDCGREALVSSGHLRRGGTSSCGCLRREVASRNYPPRRQNGLSYSNTSGVTGVSWDRTARKWRASVIINGKSVHLGSFVAKEDAIRARRSAEAEHIYPQE